jgi:hypothetical protein
LFQPIGHGKDSREFAVHFFSAFQGMAAVALGANDQEVVVMELDLCAAMSLRLQAKEQ